jgi:hypothetical protein
VARLRRCHARMAVRTAPSSSLKCRAALGPTDGASRPCGRVGSRGCLESGRGSVRGRHSQCRCRRSFKLRDLREPGPTVCLVCPAQNSPAGTGRYFSAGHDFAPQPLHVIRLLVDYQTEEWLSSVVPGAFAGPWTPLPRHFPARIRFVVAQTVRAGKRRGTASGGGPVRRTPTVRSDVQSTADRRGARLWGSGPRVHEWHKVRRGEHAPRRAEGVQRLPVPWCERRGSY